MPEISISIVVNENEAPAPPRRLSITHVASPSPKTRGDERLAYFKKINIAPTLSVLVDKLLAEQPAHPVSFISSCLRTQGRILEALEDCPYDADPRIILRTKFESASDDLREYIEKHKIAMLFHELLLQMHEERPDDPIEYVFTWLRWNRAHYEE